MRKDADSADALARALRRRCLALGSLRRAAAFATVGLFAWGVAALALRAAGAPIRPFAAAGAALLAACPFAAAWIESRRAPRAEQWRALLDARSGCGGLLVAAAETPLGEWRSRLPPLRAPRLNWNPRPELGRFLLAAAFAAGAALAPAGAVAPFQQRRLEVGQTVRRLEERLSEIEQTALIPTPEAESLRAQLERAAAETSGDDPARTWEMLDRLAEQIERAARENAAEAMQQAAALAQAADAAVEALRRFEAESGDPSATGAASSDLERAVRELAEALQNPALAAALDPEAAALLAELMKDAPTWSAEDLKRLTEALGRSGGDLAQALASARQFQILDPRDLERILEQLKNACGQCAGGGEGEGDSVALAFGEGGEAAGDLAALAAGLPGAGGISRGPGAAEISFHETESSPEGAEFKPVVLPRPPRLAADGSAPLGLSAAAPDTSGAAAPDAAGALAAPGGGAAARRHTLLPQHRGAVRRYFERTEGSAP
mgnify:CR=1 FL=1